MPNREFPKNTTIAEVVSLVSYFPRMHLYAACSLVAALLITTAFPKDKQSTHYNPLSNTIAEFSLGTSTLTIVPSAFDYTSILEKPAEEDIVEPELKQGRIFKSPVKNGDTLSTIFRRAGLNDQNMYNLVNSRREGKSLANLRPGSHFEFSFDRNDQLLSITHQIDDLTSETFTAKGEKFDYAKTLLKPEIKVTQRSGQIQSSLYKAGLNAGLNDDLILGLASIFGSDIDFALDLRRGDSFKIIYEEKYHQGKLLGFGEILAAEFINDKTEYKAVRYENKEGEVHYYSPSGQAMRKAFLRAPLDFRKITSNFNPRRLHPITRVVRPHRGIDYAAASGTPIWASGDGKVIQSGYTEANGNFVVLQHGGDIQTKYLHLTKRAVKPGQRIKQGQVLGTVGSTGYATGPHLHYEFLLNGVHRDPRTILDKLPKTVTIPAHEKSYFLAQTKPLVNQLGNSSELAHLDNQTQR